MAFFEHKPLASRFEEALSSQFREEVVGSGEFRRGRNRLADEQQAIDRLLAADEELILATPTVRSAMCPAGVSLLTDRRIVMFDGGKVQNTLALADFRDADPFFVYRFNVRIRGAGTPEFYFSFSVEKVRDNVLAIIRHQATYFRTEQHKREEAQSQAAMTRTPSGAHRLPADILDRLSTYGRYEVDPASVAIDEPTVWGSLLAPVLEYSKSDPSGFARDVRRVAIPAGGWAVYGASRCLWQLLVNRDSYADYLAVLDAGLDFLRSQGGTPAQFRPYESARWHETH